MTIAVCVGLSLGGAAAYLALIRPTWRAESVLAIELAGSGGASDAPSAAPARANLHTQQKVLKSTEILTLNAAQLRDLRTFADADDWMARLKEHLTVDIGEKDQLVTVAYETPVREDAPVIVNAVVDAYTRFHAKQDENVVAKLQSILGGQRDQTRKELEEKSNAMIAYRRSHGVLDYDRTKEADVDRERLSGLLKALTDATTDRVNAQLAYTDAVKTLGDDPEKLAAVVDMRNRGGIRMISREDADLLRSEMFQSQARLRNMQQQYLPDHPRVKAIQKRVDDLATAYVAAMESRWLAATQREKELQAAFDDQNKKSVDRGADAAEYARMKAEVDRLEKLLTSLDSEITKINVSQAAESALRINVYEKAVAPDKPYRPDWRRGLAYGGGIGLLLGLFAAFVRDRSDPRLRSLDDIQAALGLPVLGSIPKMPSELAAAVRGQQIILDPTSDVSESYRALRTSLKFGATAEHDKTIVVTSPNAGEGKSTLASNLAIALAQVGKHVLVLDADLRRPGQHDIFGAENGVGLSSILEEDAAIDSAIQKTTVEGLEILPAGPNPENPSEILNHPRFAELLDTLADRYDHVVIDTPPTLPVTDARIIAAAADGTVLVLRADRADRNLSQIARDGLMGVGARVVGVVINQVSRRTSAYGYLPDADYLSAPAEATTDVHLASDVSPERQPSLRDIGHGASASHGEQIADRGPFNPSSRA